MDFLYVRSKTLIEQPIRFIENERAQFRRPYLTVWIGQYVFEPTRSAHEDVTPLLLNLSKTHRLERATYSCLYNDTSVSNHLLCFDRDLLCKFSGRRDNDGSNVRAV